MEHVERWFRNEGVKPELKIEYEGCEIGIADDDQIHFDAPDEFPGGYYLTTYAVRHKKQTVCQPLYFNAAHEDMANRTPKGRIVARINTAIANAKGWVRDAKLAGWYEQR